MESRPFMVGSVCPGCGRHHDGDSPFTHCFALGMGGSPGGMLGASGRRPPNPPAVGEAEATTSTVLPRFGALLRRHRLAAGLTQEALAGRAGLSARAVSDLERDAARLPRLDSLALLGDALALTAAELAILRAAARPLADAPASSSQRRTDPAQAPRAPLG